VCDAWSGVSFGVRGQVRMYSRVVGCGGSGKRGDMVVIGCGFFWLASDVMCGAECDMVRVSIVCVGSRPAQRSCDRNTHCQSR
jgi:hypothetical protein